MDIKITPSRLCGEITVIPSKSHLSRLMLADFLAGKSPRKIENPSDDIRVFADCLERMKNGSSELYFGSSATAARMLIPVYCAISDGFDAVCSPQLSARPFVQLARILRSHGVEVSSDSLPASFRGKLTNGEYEIPADISSQFLSGFLFALPLLEKPSLIKVVGNFVSRPYVNMTLSVLSSYGIDIQSFKINGNEKFIAPNKAILPEGDWSDGAFYHLANLLGADIEIHGLNYDSLQGDSVFYSCINEYKSGNDRFYFDISDTPDLLCPLTVAACCKKAITKISGCSRLRYKESNRIISVSEMLDSLAGKQICSFDGETLTVNSDGLLIGGKVNSQGDHRIVMSATIASSICKDKVIITGAEAVVKSYPSFFEDFKNLGGKFDVL